MSKKDKLADIATAAFFLGILLFCMMWEKPIA